MTRTLGYGLVDWSQPGKVLSADQRKFYETNGYIIIRNCVPNYELDRYKKRFQEICEAPRGANPALTIMRDISIAKSEFKAGEKAVTKLQEFHDDEVLFDYCKYPAIVDVLSDLIGTPNGNIVSMHTMLINKPPDTGSLTSRHPMHQDQHYFPFEPPDFICCAWTAMEKINRANGCLVVVPGSHKGPALPHSYPKWEGGVNYAYYGIQDFDPDMPRTHVEMEAGDTVFFHPLIIHGSGVNKTDGFRKAISSHYANADQCKYVELQGDLYAEMKREVGDMARLKLKKLGVEDAETMEIDYADIWRTKARPVTGTSRANL